MATKRKWEKSSYMHAYTMKAKTTNYKNKNEVFSKQNKDNNHTKNYYKTNVK